jgi:hypothetical protein
MLFFEATTPMWRVSVLSLLYAFGLAKWEKRVHLSTIKALDEFQVRALYDAYSSATKVAVPSSMRTDDGGFEQILHGREMYENDNAR